MRVRRLVLGVAGAIAAAAGGVQAARALQIDVSDLRPPGPHLQVSGIRGGAMQPAAQAG